MICEEKSLRFILISGKEDELILLQKIFIESPLYFNNCHGRLPGDDEALKTITELPPSLARENKFTWIVYLNDDAIGAIDALKGFPLSSIANLGLLLLSEKHQSLGYGKMIYQNLEKVFKTWNGIEKIRLGVVRNNSIVIPFWEKNGFIKTGEVKPWSDGNFNSEVIVFEKKL